jgi:methylmalonyl-CoA/ethylmalonyl-CoA epimerase
MPVERALAAHILCLDHIGIAVADLEQALTFYTETLGFELRHREINVEQQVEEAMIAAPGSAVAIQLLAPTSPESAISKFINTRGEGLQQIAYRVDDVEAASAAAREAGLRLIYDAPRRGTLNSRINFIHPKDAGGVLVELVELANN